jgi:hypothetical protein
MRKIAFILSLGAMSAVLLAARVEASVQSTLVGGLVNELEDQDFEIHIEDVGGDGRVTDGDILLAMLEVTRLNTISGINTLDDGSTSTDPGVANYDATTDTFTAVSLLVANDPIISGDEATYTFRAATAADWLAYTGLSDVDVGTMLVLFDDPPPPVGSDPHADPDTGTILGDIATATEGTRLWEFGFTGPLGAAAAGEFWIAETEADGGGDPTDINDITDLDFLANINLIDPNSGLPLVPHNALGDPDISGTPLIASLFTPAHLQLQGNIETGDSGDFDIRTDTNLYLQPIPEPISVFVWSCLLGLAALITRRVRLT